MSLLPAARAPSPPARVWIDTDAACGEGERADPDDCLALLALARSAVDIVGISTVFGNAPLSATDRVARSLAQQLGRAAIAVHAGAAAPLPEHGWPAPPPAVERLREALARERLTLVALGPLTNIAQALHGRPDLAANVQRVIAVMGRRPGHLFHPAEGAEGATLFGHGPVFRDFNFDQDPRAAAEVLAYELELVLVPYDAARHVEVRAADLDRLAARGGAAAWVAARSRAWLDFWRRDIGRAGFYPFDLLAAAYAIEPARLACARVQAGIGRDPQFLLPWRATALLVTQRRAELSSVARLRPALYCPAVAAGTTAGMLLP